MLVTHSVPRQQDSVDYQSAQRFLGAVDPQNLVEFYQMKLSFWILSVMPPMFPGIFSEMTGNPPIFSGMPHLRKQTQSASTRELLQTQKG